MADGGPVAKQAASRLQAAWRHRAVIAHCAEMRRQLPWIMGWAFEGMSLTQVLPRLHSAATRDLFEVLMLRLGDLAARPASGELWWALLCSCAVVSSQPDSRLWCPACVVYTRLVRLLLNPRDLEECALLLEAVASFDAAIVYEHTFSWDIEQLGVISSEERLSSLPAIIWGAANDYLCLSASISRLEFDGPFLSKIDRTRALMQVGATGMVTSSITSTAATRTEGLASTPTPFEAPGPLTPDGRDVDLMLVFFGENYHAYCMLMAAVAEEYMEPDWHLQFQYFVAGALRTLCQQSERGVCPPVASSDNSTLFSAKLQEFAGTGVDRILGHVLDTSQNPRTLGAARALLEETPRDKQLVIQVLAVIEQHLLDTIVSGEPPAFDRRREVAQLATDLRHGCNLGMISTVDFIVTSRDRKNGKASIFRMACARYAKSLLQIPKPEFLMKLPAPLVLWSFEIQHVSTRLRQLTFAQILFVDLRALGSAPSDAAKREILAVLSSLPLYIDTKAINTVAERVCLVVSQHAGVDFDNLDAVYDRVINVLIQNDERIQHTQAYLQECVGAMFDPAAEATLKDLDLKDEFLAILERTCQIVSLSFWVYGPIFDAMFEM